MSRSSTSLVWGFDSRLTRTVVAAWIGAIAYYLWNHPTFQENLTPLWIVTFAFLAILANAGRIPRVGWVWWLYGVMSVLWSLTPGATLAAALWTLLYLSALAVGTSVVFVPVAIFLGLDGLVSAMTLQAFGWTEYFSGSVHYLMGAVALVALPWVLSRSVGHRRWYGAIPFALISGLLTFASLSSGSRAVYVGMLVVFLGTTVRLLRAPRQWTQLLVALLVCASLVVGADRVIPGHPVATAVISKSIRTSRVASSAIARADSGASFDNSSGVVMGAIQSRLLMWDQALRIGLDHPLGTGLGSFRETIQGFQIFPTVNFASAHNFVLETFATQGWPGTMLLLVLIGKLFREGWSSAERWPFALGAAALFVEMLFDITWTIPVIPLLAFWALGAGRQATYGRPMVRSPEWRWFPIVGLTVALALAAYWMVPCRLGQCTIGLRAGFRPLATEYVKTVSPTDQARALVALKALYPRSVWVWSLAVSTARTPHDELDATKALVERFPRASTNAYLDLAKLALSQGRTSEARQALETGLHYFPPSVVPAGVPFAPRGQDYASWIEQATTMLGQLRVHTPMKPNDPTTAPLGGS